MKIGAIIPQSLIDYPGKVSAVFFTIGCNFKCPHCYNIDLVLKKLKPLPDKKIEEFLEERKNFINAVILSGGEPTLQEDIIDFAQKIKKHNLYLGIETNGHKPEILSRMIDGNLLDFIAMDIKADLNDYEKATGVKVNKNAILRSINLLKNSSIPHEFRVTVVPNLIKKENIENIGKLAKGSKIVLQQFINDKEMINKDFKKLKPYPSKKIEEFKKILSEYSNNVELRNV